MKEKIKKEKEPQRQQFDSRWRYNPYRIRGGKLLLEPNDEQYHLLRDYQETHAFAVNEISPVVHGKLKNKIKDIKGKGKFTSWKAEEDENMDFFVGLKMNRQRHRRGVFYQAERMTKGYKARNKKFPDTPPRLRNKESICFQDGVTQHLAAEEKLRIFVLGLNEEGRSCYVDVPYNIYPGTAKNKEHMKPKCGGHLIHRDGKFQFAYKAEVPFHWKYEPEASLGMDINKENKYFIVFSKAILINGKMTKILPSSDRILVLSDRLKKLNDERRRKDIPSKERRGVYRKLKLTHKRLEKECLKICEAIIEFAIENKLLICVDDLKVGAGCGSFGQDKVNHILIKMCENRCIPFVAVPPHHTSKACNKCGNECHLKGNIRTCPIHGKFNTHENACLNIADWGWRIFTDGKKAWTEWKKGFYLPNPKPEKKKKPAVV